MDFVAGYRTLSLARGGIKGNTKLASDHLTDFAQDAEEDTRKMQADLKQTLDKLRELEKKK